MSDKRLTSSLLQRIRSRPLGSSAEEAERQRSEVNEDNQGSGEDEGDDSVVLIPDTPSPVFLTRGSVARRQLRVRRPPSKLSLRGRTTIKDTPSPTKKQTALELLKKQRLKRSQKSAARREEVDEEEASESEEVHFEDTAVREEEQEEEELPTCPIQTASDERNNEFEIQDTDSGASSSSSSAAGQSSTENAQSMHFHDIVTSALLDSDSDSTDIDESDFDDFIRGVLAPKAKQTVKPDGKRKVDTPEQPRRKRTRANGSTPMSSRRAARTETSQEVPNSEDDTADDINILASLDTMVPSVTVDDDDVMVLEDMPESRSPHRRSNFFNRSRRSHRPINQSGAAVASSNQSGASQFEESPSRRRRRVPMAIAMTSTPSFALPMPLSSSRNGATSTQARVSGLRRRGSRNRRPVSSSNCSLVVSPESTANHQLAEDEAMARRLQEEMDREFAATLASSGSPAPLVSRGSHALTSPGCGAPSGGRLGGARPMSRARASGAGARPGTMCRRQVTEAAIDYDTRMFMTIGEMSDHDWQVHQAIYYDRDTPPTPPDTASRPIHEILNPEVLDFLEHYQNQRRHQNRASETEGTGLGGIGSMLGGIGEVGTGLGGVGSMLGGTGRSSGTETTVSTGGRARPRSRRPGVARSPPVRPASRRPGVERSPVRPASRRNTRSMARPTATATTATTNESARRLREELDYETSMLMRIGGMSEHDWDIHQSVYNAGEPNSNQLGNRTLEDILDPEILSFMTYNSNRRRHEGGRGRQRGRRAGHASRRNNDASFHNDYEYLLNLAETIGDAKPRGLTDHQVSLLPTKVYRAADVTADGVKECNICFCDYDDGETLRLLQCFHYFHSGCIDRWLKENPSCPICRVEVKFE